MLLKKFTVSAVVASSLLLGSAPFVAGDALAQTNAGQQKKEKRKTYIIGPRVGKKVQKAYELYSADQVNEALEILKEIKPSKDYDKAYVDRMIGNLMAGQEGRAKEALTYLERAAKLDILNEVEHAQVLRLIADLNIQQENFKAAEQGYMAWMEFTGKEDADVYTRIANARYQNKDIAGVVPMADKAIALYKKPNKNPYILKMQSFYERKMYKESIAVSEILVKTFPQEKSYWSRLGMMYMLVEDYSKALSVMELAYKQNYLDKPTEFKVLAQLYATQNIPYKSAMIQEKYIKSGVIKRDFQSVKAMASSFHSAKVFDKAAKYYGEAGKLKNDADMFRRQGSVLLGNEKYSQAIAPLKKAIELGIKNPGRVHMNLVEAYFYMGKYKSAYEQAKLAAKDPRSKKLAKGWMPHIKDKAQRNGVNI